jgi:hypothetical protein
MDVPRFGREKKTSDLSSGKPEEYRQRAIQTHRVGSVVNAQRVIESV